MDKYRGKIAEISGVSALFIFLTMIMYYPISLNMSDTISDRCDGLLHTWQLAWNVHKLLGGLSGFWDANIFRPHTGALAYTDHLIPQSIIAFPFYYFSGNPILAHNAVTFIGFVLCGLGAYLLAKHLTGNSLAAMIAGVIYAYCPWRFSQIGHETQMLANQWLPFSLLFLHRTFENKNRIFRDGMLFGIFFALHALSSFYHAATGAIAAATIISVEMFRLRGRFSRDVWKGLAAGLILILLMIAPTIAPYYRVENSQGLRRDLSEAESLSADPLDYFRAPPENRTWGKISSIVENRYSPFPNENRLFVGAGVLLLALIGVFGKKYREIDPFIKSYFWVALIAGIFSLGPWLHLGWRRLPIPLPYMAAYYLLPGFGGLRVPSRFGVIVELGLAVIASFGAKRLIEYFSSPPKQSLFGVLLLLIVSSEFISSPLGHYRIPTGAVIPPVYKWLGNQDGDFVIAELPQAPNLSALPREKWNRGDPLGFRYMYYSTYHWKKTINGRSGFIPRTSEHIWNNLVSFPSKRSLNLLKYLGVKYVVLHTDGFEWNDEVNIDGLIAASDAALRRVETFGPDIVYEISDAVSKKPEIKWDDIIISETVFPAKIKPGAKFNVEICLTPSGDAPVYSFKLIPFSAVAKVSGDERIIMQTREHNAFLMLDPDGTQWNVFTFESPKKAGNYKWELSFMLGEGNEVKKTFNFDQETGDFSDSGSPGKLKAEFIELQTPAIVKAGEKFVINAIVKNTGDTYWRAYPFDGGVDRAGTVMIGIKDWLTDEGKSMGLRDVCPYSTRGFMEKSAPPDAEITLTLEAQSPAKPGKYKLIIEMVDEKIGWFGEMGGGSTTVDIEVTAP